MNLSYWEYKTWLSNVDFTIVGSGIVGLNCALYLKERFPKSKILILEKGFLPQGASTKNAGFACFGSISEILGDLERHSENQVVELVQKRWNGVLLLRKNLGDKAIGFENHGGHELFLEGHKELYERCMQKRSEVNGLLFPVFKGEAFKKHPNTFNFKNIHANYITNTFESQLDTGKMMRKLLQLVIQKGITILNSVVVLDYSENSSSVLVKTDYFEFKTKKLMVATNGFASKLLNEEVKPARAQVLLTEPIEKLRIKGAFHFDGGYYYFRNVDNRILFGGGRNIDVEGEETIEFGETESIQNRLEKLLREVILPEIPFGIERRWSGILGLGSQKTPIVKGVSNNVYCGVRLGGMGIAIGSLVGKELADLV